MTTINPNPFKAATNPNPFRAETFTGGCYCQTIRYTITIPPDDPTLIRTSLCHCRNCKKFTGSPYGITTRIPVSSFAILPELMPHLVTHAADNGSGSVLTRQFCGVCGSGILEFGEKAEGKWRYVFWGTLDEEARRDARFDPKGEFFVKDRVRWLGAVEGCFQKREIME